MMSEVDHLSVCLSQFAQNMPGWPPHIGISCYKHVSTCSYAFVSSLFPRE